MAKRSKIEYSYSIQKNKSTLKILTEDMKVIHVSVLNVQVLMHKG